MSEASAIPLCVDLDGTLIHTDLLLESFLLLVRSKPLYVFAMPFWLLKGRPVLKAEIARRVNLDPAALPYNHAFLEWLHQEKKSGRHLWLCTGSHLIFAEAVARHLNIFEGVLATRDSVNFTGTNKARALTARFGERGFDYCGNADVDLHVWSVSRGAIVVNGSKELERRASEITQVLSVFQRPDNV